MTNNFQNIQDYFKKVDPVIYDAMHGLDFDSWITPAPKDKYFESLCRSIISQQLGTKVARVINERFRSLFPDNIIDAKTILNLEDQTIRDIGASWAKVKYIKDLAEKHLNKEVNLENIDQLNDKQVIHELTKVKGIGPWTAEMFLIFTLGREDVFSFGDLGLKRGLEKLYELTDPTTEEVKLIIDRWTPYKSYGSITLWHSLE